MSIALICDDCGEARRLEEGALHPVILPEGWARMSFTLSGQTGVRGSSGTETRHTCQDCTRKRGMGTPNPQIVHLDPKRLR